MEQYELLLVYARRPQLRVVVRIGDPVWTRPGIEASCDAAVDGLCGELPPSKGIDPNQVVGLARKACLRVLEDERIAGAMIKDATSGALWYGFPPAKRVELPRGSETANGAAALADAMMAETRDRSRSSVLVKRVLIGGACLFGGVWLLSSLNSGGSSGGTSYADAFPNDRTPPTDPGPDAEGHYEERTDENGVITRVWIGHWGGGGGFDGDDPHRSTTGDGTHRTTTSGGFGHTSTGFSSGS